MSGRSPRSPARSILAAMVAASGFGAGLACNQGDLLVGRIRDAGFDATAAVDASAGADAEADVGFDGSEEGHADAAVDGFVDAGPRPCDFMTTGPCPPTQYCQFDDADPCPTGHGRCVDRPAAGQCGAGADAGAGTDARADAGAASEGGARSDDGGVCGCNQVVYASACEARAAGADILGPSALCPASSPAPCNSKLGLDCPPGDFCDFVDLGCGSGIQGRCLARERTPPCEANQLPDGALDCTPICGCDLRMYCTECFANRDGGVDRTASSTGTCQ